MESTKLCTKCGEAKPLSEFNKNSGRPDGRRSECALCQRAGQTKTSDVHMAEHKAESGLTDNVAEDSPEHRMVVLSGKSDKRITSLSELFEFFEIPYRWEHGCDLDEGALRCPHSAQGCAQATPVSDQYEVQQFTVRGNSWDMPVRMGKGQPTGVQTMYQYKITAVLRPKSALESADVVKRIWDEFAADAILHLPTVYEPIPRLVLKDAENPQLLELALLDPHLGMLAWGKEVGVPYDLNIGIDAYRKAFRALLAVAEHYSIERICFLVGHDLFHVDSPGFNMKGGARGGATTAGTIMDIDTRIARLFTHVRRLIVDCIDEARLVAPVDVIVVPGNHDRHTMYKFGEVLQAWYRNDDQVAVYNTPSVRDYYLYGGNLFMFTHGEEFYRKRDNLVSIFATECPPDMWVRGKVREIHVGHNHINMEKVFTGEPTSTMWEGRATRVRSLPGLTTEDAWHFEQGYKHTRRGTALVWNKAGGMAGLHEFLL